MNVNVVQAKSITLDSFYRLTYPEGASHMDGLPAELKSVVSNHWAQFPPQHPLVVDVFGVFFFALTFLSLLGNGLVIYVFLTTKSLRTPTNMFIVNLSVADCGIMLTQGPLMFINAFASDFWMWGPLLCKLYGCTGGIFGTVSIMTMVVIGYDRYNVIVKGFSGTKITAFKAFVINLFIWAYACGACLPPFFGWGNYALEGLFMTCSYDYMTEDWNTKTFILYAFVFNYCVPMLAVIFFYSQIAQAVFLHEAALRNQAKKMNVDSLRSGQNDNNSSAEVRIAKVAITNVTLWICIWTPYAVVVMIGAFGNRDLVTPLVSQIPSFLSKLASVLNPLVFALNHPKFKQALAEKCPCLCCGSGVKKENQTENVTLTQSS